MRCEGVQRAIGVQGRVIVRCISFPRPLTHAFQFVRDFAHSLE
jgi:hypothetical protein